MKTAAGIAFAAILFFVSASAMAAGTILVVYDACPPFPATDQNPAAERYLIGGKCVDAVGGQPSKAEVLAFGADPDASREQAIKDDASRADLISRLNTATPAQIDAWVDANATTVAQTRAVLKAILKVLALDARQ